jgi:hypothetical protein
MLSMIKGVEDIPVMLRMGCSNVDDVDILYDRKNGKSQLLIQTTSLSCLLRS